MFAESVPATGKVTGEEMMLIEGQLREARTGMASSGTQQVVTLLDPAGAVEAHRAQRREAVR